MKKIILTGILFLISGTFINGCSNQGHTDNYAKSDSTTKQAKVESKDITVEEFKMEMKDNPDLIILDVRTPQELTGEFPKIKSAINIPVQELENRVDELTPYKDKKIIVICRTGKRSKIATDILAEKGFKVENVLGGMIKYLSN